MKGDHRFSRLHAHLTYHFKSTTEHSRSLVLRHSQSEILQLHCGKSNNTGLLSQDRRQTWEKENTITQSTKCLPAVGN